jgi:hypothetical protein
LGKHFYSKSNICEFVSVHQQQELALVNLVLVNKTIRLHQLREQIIADHTTFHNINRVSMSTLCHILRQHQLTMKQLYRVPFERNRVTVQHICCDCVLLALHRYIQTKQYV